MAPIGYSKRAMKKFPDAVLKKIPGAGHGLYGHIEEIQEEIIRVLKEA